MLMHTKGILVMTPGERDGADRQAGARLLRRRVGRGQLRHRRLRAHHGPERAGAVLGARPRRRVPRAARLLRAHLRRAGRALPAPRGDHRPDRPRRRAPPSIGRPARISRASATSSPTRANPGRKKPFDIRSVMRAVVDADHPPLERWAGMRSAEIAVVWDAHLGGWPVALIGIESRPLPRHGLIPADGPEQWTSGTLFPRASKKIARAVNAASGRRPLVVLANLAGFDGSPESMREWQLEFGAEIGRAVVNFDGPIVFCVVSRYHGGAFVVFSQRLNEQLEAYALRGLSRVGHRRRPGSRGGVRARRRAGRAARPADRRARRADRRRRRGRASAPAGRARRAVGHRAVRAAGCAGGRVRRHPQRRARRADGLGARHRRAAERCARSSSMPSSAASSARSAGPRSRMTAPGWLTASPADVPARKFRRRRALR